MATVYLVVATVFVYRFASSPADFALAHALVVLVGLGTIVTFGLFVHWAGDDEPTLPAGYQRVGDNGELEESAPTVSDPDGRSV